MAPLRNCKIDRKIVICLREKFKQSLPYQLCGHFSELKLGYYKGFFINEETLNNLYIMPSFDFYYRY
jgi:hypothetical protein